MFKMFATFSFSLLESSRGTEYRGLICVYMWTGATPEDIHIIIPCVCVCVLLCVVLPSDSPPCSWLKPAGAVTPLPHWSEVEPAPGLKRLEETRTRLRRDFGRME